MSADAFVGRFVKWAESREDVHGVLLVGSRARSERRADRWSDVDLVLVVDEPRLYLGDEVWLAQFGRPLLTYVEPTLIPGTFERRVLYEQGLDVDVAVFTLASLERAAGEPEVAGVLARGHQVLLDRADLADLTARAISNAGPRRRTPDSDTLHDLGADFWYHALWAAKKLARGELLMATRTVDGLLKERLIALIGRHARTRRPAIDTWHEARFFEQWADSRALEAMSRSYARYDRDDVARALLETIDAFELFERETSLAHGLGDPPGRDQVRALVAAVLGAP